MRLGGRRNYYGLGTDLIRTQDIRTGAIRAVRASGCDQRGPSLRRLPEHRFHCLLRAPRRCPHEHHVRRLRQGANWKTPPSRSFSQRPAARTSASSMKWRAAVAGGEEEFRAKPFLINYSEPTPPLTHSFGALSKLLFCAEKGIPVCYTPAAMLGASAPVTVGGGLVQTNAEALSGLVIHQLKARGAPIISGVALPPLDMRTSCISYAAPEMRLANSAFADLFHYYDLPGVVERRQRRAHLRHAGRVGKRHGHPDGLARRGQPDPRCGLPGPGSAGQPGHDRDVRRADQLRQAHSAAASA